MSIEITGGIDEETVKNAKRFWFWQGIKEAQYDSTPLFFAYYIAVGFIAAVVGAFSSIGFLAMVASCVCALAAKWELLGNAKHKTNPLFDAHKHRYKINDQATRSLRLRGYAVGLTVPFAIATACVGAGYLAHKAIEQQPTNAQSQPQLTH